MFSKDANGGDIGRPQALPVFSLGDIPGNAGEQTPAIQFELAKRNLQSDSSSVLSESGQFHALPANVPLPSFDVPTQSHFMDKPQIFGHEHHHRLAQHFRNGITENPFCRGVYKEDRAALVDRDDGIGSSLSDDGERRFEIRRDVLHRV